MSPPGRLQASPSLLIAAALGFVGFVTSFGAHIVAVNLPIYAETVGVGVAVIGLLIAVYDFAELLAKPIFGRSRTVQASGARCSRASASSSSLP